MSNIRSRDLSTIERLQRMSRYRLVGLAVSLVCAFLAFLAVWFINGFTTSWAVYRVGGSLLTLINRLLFGRAFVMTATWAWCLWTVGVIVHFTVSTIEQHLWRMGDRRLYPLIAVVAFIDIGTAALGVLAAFSALGYEGSSVGLNIVSTTIGGVIAILPEVMMAIVAGALAKLATHRPRRA